MNIKQFNILHLVGAIAVFIVGASLFIFKHRESPPTMADLILFTLVETIVFVIYTLFLLYHLGNDTGGVEQLIAIATCEHKRTQLVTNATGCYVVCPECKKMGPTVLANDPEADGSPAQHALTLFDKRE